MNRTAAIAVAIPLGMLALVLPVLLSWQLAQRQGMAAETERVDGYAQDILRRSERANKQLRMGLERLNQAGTAEPCSDAQMALMGELDLTSSYLQTLGYVANGRLMCSSLGRHGEGVPLQTDDLPIAQSGLILRTRVRLAIAPGITFIVVEKNGYAAVIHESLPIDVSTTEPDAVLATYSPTTLRTRATRGNIKPEWLRVPPPGGHASFSDGSHLVVVARSPEYGTVALAAVPLASVQQRAFSVARVAVPFGVLAGLGLAAAVYLLTRRQLSMPALLRAALRRHELFLLYQPVIDLQSGRCVGAEALLRWRRRDGSMVRPDVFIPVTEESGLIAQVTRRVLQLAARDTSALFQAHPDCHVGINLSHTDLQSPTTVQLLKDLLRDSGASPRAIMVEATERGLVNAEVARGIIRDVRALGISVAVDDFGTGYSSLSYLGSFELDHLKIDKSFVDTIGTDAATSHVVLHIIEMAKSLKLAMIAEGVETPAQADFLRERGVQLAQGWLFGKPMPMAELLQLLAREQAARGG